MSSPHSYVVVDVFARVPLEGNPVAVFTDGAVLDGATMQRAARELNLSETVFLLPPTQQGAHARARIFTPATELPFAGHPVLGTAFVIGDRDGTDDVLLETGAGVVQVTLEREGGRIASGEMVQPIPTWEPFDRVDELLGALGVERAALPVEAYANGPRQTAAPSPPAPAVAGASVPPPDTPGQQKPRHVMVALEDEGAVRDLAPDLGALARLGRFGVSCFASSGPSVKTRMFGPGIGVPEDPATGSAAGPLAVHLARHGRVAFGERLEIHQGAEIGRPSVLYAVAEGAAERIQRVLVAGNAVVVASGTYRLG